MNNRVRDIYISTLCRCVVCKRYDYTEKIKWANEDLAWMVENYNDNE